MVSFARLALLWIATFLVSYAACTFAARAQEAAPSPAPAQTAAASGGIMDREYDGTLRASVVPYVWLPTLNGNFEHVVPALGWQRAA